MVESTEMKYAQVQYLATHEGSRLSHFISCATIHQEFSPPNRTMSLVGVRPKSTCTSFILVLREALLSDTP